MSIRDAYHDFITLSTVPARVFEFIALCQFSMDEGLDGSDRETAQSILAEAQALEEMLRNTIPTAFEEEATAVPDALEAERLKAVDAATGVIRRLKGLESAASFEASELRAAFDENRQSFMPVIGSTMSAFETALARFEQDSSKDQRSVINSAVSEIDDINSVINLISVNASVEAARAGEAGRGFAVIASEIQTLSQRSKQAVHDIRNRLR